MNNNFAAALKRVLKHEGGFSDHPQDPGGATMKGVTLKVFRSFFGDDQTVDQLKAITEEQLQLIYKTGYWDPVKGDELPDGVDYCVFDAAVNSGPGRSVRWLQGAVGSGVDGIIGRNTLAKVKQADPLKVVEQLCSQRLAFLQGLSTWETFGRGWGRRVAEVQQIATAMASGQQLSEPEQQQAAGQPVTVGMGQVGPWVTKVQQALDIPADGIFGSQTQAAVKSFQLANGLAADGIAGPDTYRAMGLIS